MNGGRVGGAGFGRVWSGRGGKWSWVTGRKGFGLVEWFGRGVFGADREFS